MRILLIGGNGFIGRFVAPALQRQGHELAILHRGTFPVPEGIEEICGDRNELIASAEDLKRFNPENVIDFVISSGSQAQFCPTSSQPGIRLGAMLKMSRTRLL